MEAANSVVAQSHLVDRVLQFGFMLRFTPPIPQLQQRVSRGEMGEPVAAQAAVFGWEPSNDWFYDPAHGGGVILDTLVHFADLLWIYGPAASVHTEGGAYMLAGARRYGSPDNATVLIRHVNGAVSSVYVSWTTGHGNFTFNVYGTDGHAGIDLVRSQALSLHLRDRPGSIDGASGWSFRMELPRHGLAEPVKLNGCAVRREALWFSSGGERPAPVACRSRSL
jgi:myo-inositol 2-dehydrogenase/D-chiro-inositol 1-dehydrogenase